MKKVHFLLLFILFSYFLSSAEIPVFNKDNAVCDKRKTQISNINSIEVVKNMITGWNLGNTLDATGKNDLSSETNWGMPYTTKKMIDDLSASGIKTIRIPVTWHNHIIDDKYTIDPDWMNRVKQIVDWAYEDGMYIILNCHHDCYEKNTNIPKGFGYYPTEKNYDESSRFLVNIWSQICLAFNNGYDEHLIFETMNEPRPCGTNDEWVFKKDSKLSIECAGVLNKLNQDVVDTIRKSGGNNANRVISIPGLQASPDAVLSDYFKIPKDSAKGKLAISVHMYYPYNFAMETPGIKIFTPQVGSSIAVTFKNLNEKFVKNGYPVIIGEYGAVNKDNLADRVKWFHFFLKYSRQYGMTSCLWDNGQWYLTGKDYNEKFGYFNRKEGTWYFPDIIKAINEETK